MLRRVVRSTARYANVLCALGVCLCTFVSPQTARAGDLSVSFAELETYVRGKGPRAQTLAQNLAALRAKRDEALRWSNPEIAYDQEEAEEYREWQVTIRKRLVRPLSRGRLRGGWNNHVEAAALEFDQSVVDLLADIRAAYVRIRLLDAYLARLDQLEAIVRKASSVADARYDEGELSGVERQLVHLSAFSLDSSRRNALQERGRVLARLRADIGVQPDDSLNLITPIRYQEVTLASPREYVEALEQRPGVRSRVLLGKALKQRAAAARSGLLPGLELYGGYKEFDADATGFVAGVAVDIPIFDRNAGVAKQLEAESRMAENDLTAYRTYTAAEISTLVESIESTQRALSAVTIETNEDRSLLSGLFQSYQEGRLTLDSFLNATQIQVSGSRDYYDQLTNYYRSIFRLEAITGTTIVSFR